MRHKKYGAHGIGIDNGIMPLRPPGWFASTSPDEGQLTIIERMFLYDTIRKRRPVFCVECGTWRGGGSTYYIGHALVDNGDGGYLLTYDVNEEYTLSARTACKNLPVIAQCKDFTTAIRSLSIGVVDFAFLDGPDDPEYGYAALRVLETKMGAGRCVVMHDFRNEKCACIVEYLDSDEGQRNWRLVDAILLPFSDVGIASIERR